MDRDGAQARFAIGELVQHRLFHYRGVVYDVDPVFSGTEEWYSQMAKSKPPRDMPWYHVLVHGATHQTYVAERNLDKDDATDPIQHPGIEYLFERLENGVYVPRSRVQ